jgi:hypothetical protein
LVSEVGIRIDKTFYEYPKIESFSVVYSGEKMVYLRLFLKKQAIGKIDLDINNEIGMALKEILPNFVAETENSSLTATEKIIGVLKL